MHDDADHDNYLNADADESDDKLRLRCSILRGRATIHTPIILEVIMIEIGVHNACESDRNANGEEDVANDDQNSTNENHDLDNDDYGDDETTPLVTTTLTAAPISASTKLFPTKNTADITFNKAALIELLHCKV